MFLVTSAVGNVTAGFMQNLFSIESTLGTVLLLFTVCILILISGNFKLLDGLIKIIGIVLLLSTLIAFCLVLGKGPQGNKPLFGMEEIPKEAYYTFLIPLMGWMPTALDLSSWNSLWTIERIKQTGYHPKLKETLFDFNLGYILSSLLAICFITLGAFIMFGTDLTFSKSGAKFSGEVVQLYTQTFGDWSNIVISASAFSIMFGTCIAVFDGYSRSMTATAKLVFPTLLKSRGKTQLYRIVLLIIALGSFLIIYLFQNDPEGFRNLVILATSISFLLAPFIAIFNLVLVKEKYVGKAFVPKKWMLILSYSGIVFLIIFTLFYLFKGVLIEWLT